MLPLILLALSCFIGVQPPDPRPAHAKVAGDLPWDRYLVTLDPAVAEAPVSGRLILFFITDRDRRFRFRRPIDAPFFDRPQPVAARDVVDWRPGETIVIDREADAFPSDVDTFDGLIRVQAMLALAPPARRERDRTGNPGNLFSDVVSAEVSRTGTDEVTIHVTRRVDGPRQRRETDGVVWLDMESPLLSAWAGRPVAHRAGVALPPMFDAPEYAQVRWPVIFVIPGYGGREGEAMQYAQMLRTPGIQDFAPMAVWVVLDPESPLGHHGFVDSPNHGPRGTAFVTELVPALEARFRLVDRPEGRLLTGHSSGGWSSLWLQLEWPQVFGACWSSAPDPVDFSAFQTIDLYEEPNAFRRADGTPHPSFRELVSAEGATAVRMTVEQEIRTEWVIEPRGFSGEQWDAWSAMFSPRDPQTGAPRRPIDPQTGAIDHGLVRDAWSKFDIRRRVEREWDRLGPVILDRVHLGCGGLDSYYLEGAVAKLRDAVERLRGERTGSGWITILPDETHNTIVAKMNRPFHGGMIEHLRRHGLLVEVRE